ncbi:aldose 1-epimerase [Salinimicrobium catena]|uniref:Aldose 1-epimerase n=1 Tax=Salinimicrobium catena TaxID=390640 RepID=A0A1H5LDI7_9FLAO|nr:aldose epimerase family protein [Salinimicrobium catena]SDL08359.1 aldose 1-epimerase [Salinimicrobium catena]SEE74627.1 aldose 1-epimerase [Salinimicrobium catena]
MKELKVVSLVNSRGTELKIGNFGATVLSLKLCNRGKTVNVVTGPEDPADYISAIYRKKGKFFGASVGRFAGRIAEGSFSIEGSKYQVSSKEGVHLHGGQNGFSYKFWKIETTSEGPDPSVTLSYCSPHGEEGFPGELRVKVRYVLTEINEVWIDYSAETDRPTIVNLTNHTYFNLNGFGDVRGHELRIDADKALEVDEKLLPTGKFSEVRATECDFQQQKMIDEIPLDTTFVFSTGTEEREKVHLKGDQSGISLSVISNQPAVVVYVPEELPDNWQYSTIIGKSRQAICLETQVHPDAPNHQHFPSVELRQGEEYQNSTRWIFKTES